MLLLAAAELVNYRYYQQPQIATATATELSNNAELFCISLLLLFGPVNDGIWGVSPTSSLNARVTANRGPALL